MPSATVQDRVKQAYIRPIRSVLVVDDDFPQYDTLSLNATPKKANDPDRGRSLWLACRNAGYLCDIDDGTSLISGQVPPHLSQSDLVILDYHLEGLDPRSSLRLLRHLAPSEHSSIVVVYTKDEDLAGVRATIACHLRGALEASQLCPSPDAQDQWDRVESQISHKPTHQQLGAFLCGDTKHCWTGNELQEELKQLGVPAPMVIKVATAYYESLIRGIVSGSDAQRTDAVMQLGGGEVGVPPWIYISNLFVACVRKTEDNLKDGSQVFAALEASLCSWDPDFMVSAAAFARSEFARGGFQLERLTLNDEKLKSGWLYHAWSGSQDEQATRIRALFDRLISTYARGVLDKMIEFGNGHVPPSPSPEDPSKTLSFAIRHFFGDQKDLEKGVIHALNEFLVTEGLPDHVETGTVFARVSDGPMPSEVYVCVTPACDLVPRPPRKHSWESSLHPARATIAIRAKVLDASAKQMLRAEDSRLVFLTIDGKQKALVLVPDLPPLPTLEWLFLADMGKITDRKLKAMQVGYPAEDETALAVQSGTVSLDAATKSLGLIASEMQVIAQIRAIYASRILQYAGQHLARIGVDFVNFPAVVEADKTAKK